MFFDEDVFDLVYEEAKKYNYDITGFKVIQANNYKAKISEMEDGCHMHNNSFTVYQPKLGLFGISEEDRFKIIEVHIWSKCIKNYIYKKAVNSLGIRKYSLFMSWAEDTSMVFILFNLAESYRYITKYGIFRFNRKFSASESMPNSHKLFGEIFFLDAIFDFSKLNFKSKKFAVYKAINIRNGIYFNSLDKINLKYLKFVLKKLLFCQYISNDDKTILKNVFKGYI